MKPVMMTFVLVFCVSSLFAKNIPNPFNIPSGIANKATPIKITKDNNVSEPNEQGEKLNGTGKDTGSEQKPVTKTESANANPLEDLESAELNKGNYGVPFSNLGDVTKWAEDNGFRIANPTPLEVEKDIKLKINLGELSSVIGSSKPSLKSESDLIQLRDTLEKQTFSRVEQCESAKFIKGDIESLLNKFDCQGKTYCLKPSLVNGEEVEVDGVKTSCKTPELIKEVLELSILPDNSRDDKGQPVGKNSRYLTDGLKEMTIYFYKENSLPKAFMSLSMFKNYSDNPSHGKIVESLNGKYGKYKEYKDDPPSASSGKHKPGPVTVICRQIEKLTSKNLQETMDYDCSIIAWRSNILMSHCTGPSFVQFWIVYSEPKGEKKTVAEIDKEIESFTKTLKEKQKNDSAKRKDDF